MRGGYESKFIRDDYEHSMSQDFFQGDANFHR